MIKYLLLYMGKCSIEEIEEGVRRLFSDSISMPIEELPKSKRIVKINPRRKILIKRRKKMIKKPPSHNSI